MYLVCPAIEDTPDGGLNAVKSYYEDIAKALLPERRVGLMHGKLKPKEKAAVMEDFKAGRLDALVSTTVIEVGVDVPNASVMVIENAERYGLSALHQLRGRVGRGAAESWCFLVSDNQSENVQKRLKFLCSTTDGFAVAQYDLETRGPGDFFGDRQHGLPTLQIADLMNDTRTLHAAQAGSRCHAGRRPAAGSAGARTAGTAGAADVRESRSHELIRRFCAQATANAKSRCTAGAAALLPNGTLCVPFAHAITSQNTQRLLVESWVSLW